MSSGYCEGEASTCMGEVGRRVNARECEGKRMTGRALGREDREGDGRYKGLLRGVWEGRL